MRHIVRWHIFGMQIVGLIRRDSVAIRHTAGWRRYRLSGLHHAIIKQRRQSAAAFGSGGNGATQYPLIGIQRQTTARAGNGGIDQFASHHR